MTSLLTIKTAGSVIHGISREQAVQEGVPEQDISAAEDVVQDGIGRDAVRGKIATTAGDHLSLLGTTSDAATIAVLVGACVMASLDEDTSYSIFREKCTGYMQAISGDHDPTQIAQAFLQSLAAGEVRLPALEKGIVPVLADVTARGNAVAEAINPSVALGA